MRKTMAAAEIAEGQKFETTRIMSSSKRWRKTIFKSTSSSFIIRPWNLIVVKVHYKTFLTSPNTAMIRYSIMECQFLSSGFVIRPWNLIVVKVHYKTILTSPNTAMIRYSIMECQCLSSGFIIRPWNLIVVKVHYKTFLTSPNTAMIRCSIMKFQFISSGSIIRSVRQYHIIVLSSELHTVANFHDATILGRWLN
jgi:hypothetical protein